VQQGAASDAATPGRRLAGAREARGIPLEKAAEDLHLDTWVVEAMESNAYAKIGPPVYVKGYLKRYASMVGLPADEIIRAYEGAQTVRAVNAEPTPPARPESDPERARWPLWQLSGVAVLAVLVMALMWWKPWARHAQRPQRAIAPIASQVASGTAPVAAPAETAPPPARVPAAGTAPSESSGATPVGTPSRLRLSFSADSWVEIRDVNRRLVFSGLGKANSIKTLHARAPLAVYLSVVNGVQLEINDRAVPIEDRFVRGDSARFSLEADGVAHRVVR
jgi:cytoskeleton protein RodZ